MTPDKYHVPSLHMTPLVAENLKTPSLIALVVLCTYRGRVQRRNSGWGLGLNMWPHHLNSLQGLSVNASVTFNNGARVFNPLATVPLIPDKEVRIPLLRFSSTAALYRYKTTSRRRFRKRWRREMVASYKSSNSSHSSNTYIKTKQRNVALN